MPLSSKTASKCTVEQAPLSVQFSPLFFAHQARQVTLQEGEPDRLAPFKEKTASTSRAEPSGG